MRPNFGLGYPHSSSPSSANAEADAAMTITILIIAFGCLALLLLFYATRRRGADISQYDSLSGRLEPVPVDALLNLIDPAQRDYLERSLPGPDFARLKGSAIALSFDT